MRQVFYILAGLCALQRLIELRHSRANMRRLAAQGFRNEESAAQFAPLVAVHTLWFAGLLLEPALVPQPSLRVSLSALALYLAAEALRAWTLCALGGHWNVRVMRAPAMKPDHEHDNICISGPYAYIRHPNYLAMIIEVAALPLIGGAYRTALLGTAAQAIVLRWRIRREESMLALRPGYLQAMTGKGRFIPHVLWKR